MQGGGAGPGLPGDLQEAFDNADEIYEDLAVVSASGDVVVASCRTTARLAGQPDAALVSFEYALKVTVEDELIQALEIYEDAAAAAR